MPTINVGPGSDLELQEIADALGKSRKVIVITGAGISTNCGIPDFRSENGLYSLIQAQYDAALQNPPWEKTDNFDIDDRPKKKRRVTDRWFYEIVPGTGSIVQDIEGPSPEETESTSPRSKQSLEGATASQAAISHNSPASTRRPTPISSPLSSPRSITPPFSCEFSLENSSILPQQTRSSTPIHLFRSSSSQSRSSRSSSVFTADDTSKDTLSQSNSSAPSDSTKTEENVTTTDPEPERQYSSSPPSSSNEDTTQDAPQLSQSTSRALPNLKGRDLFDSMVWSDPFTTSIFYMFISSLREKIQKDVKSTTPTHKFIRTLRDGGRLVRNYTQNIDSLEEREHLCTDLTMGAGSKTRFQSKYLREPRPRSVERGSALCGGVECVLLHGSLGQLRCGICGQLCSWDADGRETTTLSGSAPDCPACMEHSDRRRGRGRRGLAVGRLRPDIVLYGEEHPNATLIAPLITHDLSLGPDFLLIMGTSLKVHGLKIMVKEFAKSVHAKSGKVVFVNRTKPPESIWGDFIDYWVESDCDAWVSDLRKRRADIWLPQGSQVEMNRRDSSNVMKADKAMKGPRIQPSRPQSVRDDKMSGVYHTFKILDSLRLIEDSNGAISTRRIYWEKAARTIAQVKPEPKKEARKSLPSSKKSTKEVVSKKRKLCPSNLPNERSNQEATRIWDRIRQFAPGLKPEPPKIGRVPFQDLHYNRDFPVHNLYMNYTRSFQDQSRNRFPWLDGLNLATHPPSGAEPPLHPPERIEKPLLQNPVVEPRPITHSYGTRAARRTTLVETAISADHNEVSDERSTKAVDDDQIHPCSLTESDTITLETTIQSTVSAEIHLDTSNEDAINGDTIVVVRTPNPSSPPISSNPTTPSSQRIKRMGSIGAILSSPHGGSNESSGTIYYDADEA